jgi:hypothetical protein
MRNGAVQVYQHNRNPFVDHPEFVAMIYDSSTVVGVGAPGLAWRLRLRANQPNPFATRTTIVFDLALRAPVTLRLYNAAGRFVRTLVAGEEMAPGSHAVEWDGVDDAGRRVGAGIYFAQLAAGPETATRRVVAVPR